VPVELFRGDEKNRDDLRTMHEEADVTMICIYQVVQLAQHGVWSMKVISDDTDVFCSSAAFL